MKWKRLWGWKWGSVGTWPIVGLSIRSIPMRDAERVLGEWEREAMPQRGGVRRGWKGNERRGLIFSEEAIYGKIARRGVKNFERRATSGWVQQVIANDVWLFRLYSLLSRVCVPHKPIPAPRIENLHGISCHWQKFPKTLHTVQYSKFLININAISNSQILMSFEIEIFFDH